MTKLRRCLLVMALLTHTASAMSWKCPEEQPNCPAPLSMKILAAGFAETSILLFTLPALSNDQIIRGVGGGVIATSGLVLLGTTLLVSEMSKSERATTALYGAGLIATGLYAGLAPDSHSKPVRFGGSFLGMNAALGFGIAIPLFVF